ncbi:zinc finger SWIM domain-containing protein [Mycolicibacterium tokaiense]|uniref:Zinc finger SWIM domain-containing protein n=1 Tax=Mycolicibacterium tokaiense TaxID=39695 RepID=A0A378TIE0_9MYCO|nr:zinc finger SWIM domain-containing protein [Mycolicibacterium tokaiense]
MVRVAAHRDGNLTGCESRARAFRAEHSGAQGFIDHRESSEVAQTAFRAIDKLHSHLDDGSADMARPALLYTLTAL